MSPLPKALRSRGTWIVLAATLACLAMVLHAWRLPPFQDGTESTENAYVRGMVTIVAPKVDGYVAEVMVQDYMAVKAGQPLVRLDDRIYRQKLDQARSSLAIQEANLANTAQARLSREATIGSTQAQIASADAQLANARAQLSRAQADMRRATPLARDGSLSQRERDQTEAALHQAEASVKQAEAAARQARAGQAVATQDLHTVVVNRDAVEAAVEAARATVRLAEIDLENTQIRAPRDGHLGEVGVKLGQYVTPGTQLMAVVPQQVWVVANFKEAQTARMAPGQLAHFHVDALADAELEGRVERLSPATGSEFSVIKQDNATGNFTKIPQRLSVRIAVDPGQPLAHRLRPGMSVVVSVDTRSSRGADAAVHADGDPS
ncbi:HlyD family secretion protein [Variovorax saccharolyticus]|uniref:HlyD family secretion protein n=1 Tax=Variovorax saccharolyticus TaxID=3053516 RepID=UPI00257589D5|nr:HlyD family secretion protein [Variovorax sp. J22R187]MDM0019760.1 HlyD family secretion protein [Variovorax sp. J22R187]